MAAEDHDAKVRQRRRVKQGSSWLLRDNEIELEDGSKDVEDQVVLKQHRGLLRKLLEAGLKLLLLLLSVAILCHRALSWLMRHRSWVPAPIAFLDRTCPQVSYETMNLKTAQSPNLPSVCITTLTDNPSTERSILQRLFRWRDFDSVLELTWDHKAQYAAKYGYRLVDGSHLLDRRRPPAWSKIIAVQDLLRLEEEVCDWVMWTDADTVIMNSEIRITDFLPPKDHEIHFLVASDKGGGYNSGVFVVRNTDWSMNLLQEWWDMKEYVRPPGLSLSGDNAALKALLARKLQDPNERRHFGVPPRCTFNSFAKFLSLRESQRLLDDTQLLHAQDWYMDTEHYHKGDFIAHTPGIDNKAECLKMLLREAS